MFPLFRFPAFRFLRIFRPIRHRMKKVLLYFLATLAGAGSPARGETVIADVFARHITSLNGQWHVIVDPYDTGYFDYRHHPYDEAAKISGGFALDRQSKDKTELIEYNFDTSPTLAVPGDWNSQDDKLFYYEGSVWYRMKFDVPPTASGRRRFLYFGAANYEADVYFNGQKHTAGHRRALRGTAGQCAALPGNAQRCRAMHSTAGQCYA